MKKYLDNSLVKNLLFPVALLALYGGSFAYLSSRLLSEGVNSVFTSRLWQYAWLLMAVTALIIVAVPRLRNRLAFDISTEKVSASHFLLLLFPLTPVVQYIISNQDILSLLDVLVVFVFFVLFSGFYIYAMPVLLGRISPSRTLMSLGLAFVFTILSMVSLSHYFSWFASGNLLIQLTFFSCVFIASWFLLDPKYRRDFYILVVVYFVVNSGFYVLTRGIGLGELVQPAEENKLQSMAAGRMPADVPNIYLLVYDAYVANETMLAHGIDNSSQEDYLRDQGFVLYSHTYTLGSNTTYSMSRVLNASTELYGSPRRGVSGDGMVQNTLSDLGYQTYGIFPSDYMFRGIGSSYDVSIPDSSEWPQSYAILIPAILLGEFRFDSGFDAQAHAKFVETKRSILSSNSGKQVFIYSHSDLPNHSQNSGACLPDEIELFKERLAMANLEMRQDIETVINNDPKAIIIVAGDHGPYLTKNCTATSGDYESAEISRLDIQDRYGSFLSIRWPTDDYTEYDDITVLQDLFPAIFAYLYADPEFLKLKVTPDIVLNYAISGISVRNGVIAGGIDDGKPLFLSGK